MMVRLPCNLIACFVLLSNAQAGAAQIKDIKQIVLNRAVESAPSNLPNGQVLVPSDDGKIRYFSPIGDLLGEIELPGFDFMYGNVGPAAVLPDAGAVFGVALREGQTRFNVFAFTDSSGELRGQLEADGKIFDAPRLLRDGRLAAVSEGQDSLGPGVLYFIDPATMTIQSKIQIGGSPTTPAILDDNTLAVGTETAIHFFEPGGLFKKSVTVPRPIAGFSQTHLLSIRGNRLVAVTDAKDFFVFDSAGNVLYHYRLPGEIHAAPVELSDGSLFFSTSNQASTGSIAYRFPGGDFSREPLRSEFPSQIASNVIQTPPAIVPFQGKEYVVFGATSGHVFLFNAEGKLLSDAYASGMIFGGPTITPSGTIVVGTRQATLRFLQLY